jgi:predicted GIY-YIG superfamily endonuclease
MAPSESRSWWVYILRCGDGTLYTGIALDVAVRLAQHRAGTGAKYTRGREPLELVYQEAAPSRAWATRREAAIKRCSREEKLRLVHSIGMPE